jgi:hypothetical protein
LFTNFFGRKRCKINTWKNVCGIISLACAKMMTIGLTIKAVGSFLELLLPDILSMIIDEIVPSGDKNGIIFWGFIMTL